MGITLTNENVLIASLIGSQAVKSLPRFAAVQNELAKHVIPPVPFLPIRYNEQIEEIRNPQTDADIWMYNPPIGKDKQFFPFSFKRETEEQFYTLPWEPMISIGAKNIISKRRPAKARSKFIGTIKERFSTDDFEITITGGFYGFSEYGKYPDTYPRVDMEKLRDYLLTAEKLEVNCEPLQILGVSHIVIEDMNFPFTKGENVQAYEIKALSDFDWDLLYERKVGRVEVGELEIEIQDE